MRISSSTVIFCFVLGSLLFPFPVRAQLSASASAPAPAFAEKLSISGISNAGKVSASLFRGAQPHLSNLSELKSLGITTIVDLRRESTQTSENERLQAHALGIHFVHIPIGGFSTPTSSQLAQFFSLLRENPPRTIFVHCEFGQDRTGVFIAAYRIAFEHWSSEQALSEMRAFGFNRPWHPEMVTFIRALPERLQSDPTLKSALAMP